MCRILLPCCVALLLGGLILPVAADGSALREAFAFEEALQNAIEEAKPAIACILVARSEEYIKLGQTPPPDGSGRLGRFSLKRAEAMLPAIDGQESARLKKLDLADPDNVPESYGSGVVIDETGLVLTNEHVIRNATKIFVRLPGQKGHYADIIAADPRSDLAVLKLLLDQPARFKAIKLGDGGKARQGQFILTLANPFAAGFRDGKPSASWGIVSNIRRQLPGSATETERVKPLYRHGTLIQTDARLNLGCSGGALIDLKGELIGLTTSLAAITGSESAGGYAIPIDAGMKRIIEVLKRGEEVEYGFLGVQLNSHPIRTEKGVEIADTVPGSPAAKKGLMSGDIILSINGVPINEYEDLFLTVSMLLAGTDAKLEFVRRPGLAPQTVTVTLDKFAVPGKFIAVRKPPAVRGLRVDYLSVLMQGLHPSARPQGVTHGVIVREVQSGTPAANALLKVNDIITHIKGQPVTSPEDFYRKMQKLTGPVELTLAGAHEVILN
jgi:S1-C subfamily serine protease